MADLQVSLAFLLENQEALAKELERTGGKIGADFGARLSAEAQTHFDTVVKNAEKAAKEAGLRFNREKLQFQTVSGDVVPSQVLDRLTRLHRGLGDAVAASESLRTQLNLVGREGTRSFNLLESAIEGVAISLTNRLSDSLLSTLGKVKGLVGGFLELDGELRLAAAAAGEEGGYKRLGAVVDKVGIDAAGTSKQVAELTTSLVRAGFSVSEIEVALAGVVRGAEATGTGFEQFGEIVGNTLRGFGLDVKETSRVVDVLVNTANSSNASITGLGYTFEYTAPIAKALGVSLEDVAAAAGLMANAGIQGSVAGTGLRTALQKLQQAAGGASPEVLGLFRGQERLQSVMKKLGATIIDTNGKLLPMETVILRLKSGLEKLNQADQVQLANILFGDEAGSKFLAITNQSTAAISKMFSDIRSSTGATDKARDAMVGMGLELQQLEGTMDSLGTTIGSVMVAGLRPLVQLANALAGAVSGMPAELKITAAALIALGSAAAATSVAVGALNLVLAQVGGFAALRASIIAVGAAFTGPVAAGIVVLGGLGAVIAALSGKMDEADKTTKVLIQTMAGLAAFVIVLKGLTLAQQAWNTATKATIVLQSLLAAVGKGKGGLLSVAGAAAAAAVTYAAIGKALEGVGEETEAMSDKASTLKSEIKELQEQIQQQKALKLDTSSAEKRLAGLYVELLAIEQPLNIRLDMKKVDSEIKTLQDRLGKIGEKAAGRVPLQAAIDGLKDYKKLLETIDQEGSLQGFSKPIQGAVEYMQQLKTDIVDLTKKKNELPLTATAQREQIDKEISNAQQRIDKTQLLIRLSFEADSTQRALDAVKEKLKTAKGEDQKQLTKEEERLELQKASLLQRGLTANKELAAIGKQQLADIKEKKQSEADRLKIQDQQLTIAGRSLELASQAREVEKARISIAESLIQAYQNAASAQARLVKSAYDVARSRNTAAMAADEERLNRIKEEGGRNEQNLQEYINRLKANGKTSTEEIAQLEQNLYNMRASNAKDIERQEEQIRRRKEEDRRLQILAMNAEIEALAQRFEGEKAILRIRQAIQQIEQEQAIQGSQQNVLQEQQKLVGLRQKLIDPNISKEEKAYIEEQIRLQEKAIEGARAQLGIAYTRRDAMKTILSLEEKSAEAQRITEANQMRATAAMARFEGVLSGSLEKLDNAALSVQAVNRETKVLVGTIESGGSVIKLYDTITIMPEPLDRAKEKAAELGGAFRAANEQARKLLGTVQELSKAPQARFAGGDAEPGQSYQVNEIGQEAFLSRAGALSLIKAPRYGKWSPPSPGVVLPASITRQLQARGAFDRGFMPAPIKAAAVASIGGHHGPSFEPLQRSIDRLDASIRNHRPTVEVQLPNNAGLLHTLQSFR